MRRKRRRWWWRLTLGVGALAIMATLLAYLSAHFFFRPERLVRKLEKKLNCRASIGEVELTLLGNPARLQIHDLELAERDHYANDRVRLKDRPKLTNPQVHAKRLTLAVATTPLLWGKLHIHELAAHDVSMKMVKPEDGDSSLEILFDKPNKKKRSRPKEREKKPKDRDEDDDDDSEFTIDDFPLAPEFKNALIKNFLFVLDLEENQTRMICENVSLRLTDFRASAADLERTNTGDLELVGQVRFDHLSKPIHYGQARLRGTGQVTPFDLETRELNPAIDFRIDVLEDSYVKTAPLLDAIVDKITDLRKYGIRLDRLKFDGDLEKEALLTGTYKDEWFTTTADSHFQFPAFSVTLREGSWYHGEDDGHEFTMNFQLEENFTARALGGLDRFVEKTLPFMSTESLLALIEDYFMQDGRLSISLLTKGDIGRPKVRFASDLPDSDALKDAAKDLLRSIFD